MAEQVSAMEMISLISWNSSAYYKIEGSNIKITVLKLETGRLCYNVIINKSVPKPTSLSTDWAWEANFTTGSLNQHTWRLKIFYPVEYTEIPTHFSLAMCLVSNPKVVPVHMIANLWNLENKMTTTLSHACFPREVFGIKKFWKLPQSPRSIDVHFNLHIFENIYPTDKESAISDTEDKVINDYTDKLLSGSRDIVLAGNGWEYSAHKNVLSEKSPVFKAMFEHTMAESINGRVEISDMQADVVRALLIYIYTGEAIGLKKVKFASELLFAADKYQMDELKSICEHYLCQHICTNNISELLSVADLGRANILRKSVVQHLAVNLNNIEPSEWENLEKNQNVLTTFIRTTHGIKTKDGETLGIIKLAVLESDDE